MTARLLSVTQAADRLAVSRPTVYRMLRDRQLKKATVRGKVRIPESEIERLAKAAS